MKTLYSALSSFLITDAPLWIIMIFRMPNTNQCTSSSVLYMLDIFARFYFYSFPEILTYHGQDIHDMLDFLLDFNDNQDKQPFDVQCEMGSSDETNCVAFFGIVS